MRLDVHQPGAATGGNLRKCANLFEYGAGDCFRRQIHLQPPEIRAIGIARMRPNRQLPAKSLLDRCLHGLFVARMPPASDVDGCERRHQRFLRAVRNRLRQLAHIAIQINF